MALEAPPERGALWLDNWVLSATIASVYTQHVNYPATHILNPHRSDTFQSVDVAQLAGAILDMGQIRTPTCFGVVGLNVIGATGSIQLLGADDSALTTNLVNYTLPLYQQDAVGKVLKWYPGTTPTSGSMGSSTNPADAASARGRQFWCIRLAPGTYTYDVSDDYFEFGVFWLGQHTNIRPWEGTRVRAKDPSMRSLSYGRAMWSDPLTPYREADVRLGGLTVAQGYELEALIRAQGSKHAVLDIHAFSPDAALKRGGALYGYFAEDPVDFTIESPEYNSLDFAFEEASG